LAPAIEVEFDDGDSAGGEVVLVEGGELVGEVGPSGIVAEEDGGVYLIGKALDGVDGESDGAMVEVKIVMDLVGIEAELLGEDFGGVNGTLGGAADHEIRLIAFFSESLSH